MRSSSAGYKKRIRQLFASTAFLFFFSVAFSQQRTVTGRVTDQDSKPLSNATVSVKGTNVSALTNTDGQYSISMPANATTLVFTYVGYQVSEVNVQGTSANVTMQILSSS